MNEFMASMMAPQQQMLLGMSMGLLNAGGASRLPVSLGQGLAQGMQQGLLGARQAQQDALQQGLLSMQLQAAQLDSQRKQDWMAGERAAGSQSMIPGYGGMQDGVFQTGNPHLDALSAEALRKRRSPFAEDQKEGASLMEMYKALVPMAMTPQKDVQSAESDWHKQRLEIERANRGKPPAEQDQLPPFPQFPGRTPGTIPAGAVPVQRAGDEATALDRAQRLNSAGAPFRISFPSPSDEVTAPQGPPQALPQTSVTPGAPQTSGAAVGGLPAGFTPPARIPFELDSAYNKRYVDAIEKARDAEREVRQKGEIRASEGYASDEVDRSKKFRSLYYDSQSKLNDLDLLESLFQNPNVSSGMLAESISGLKSLADSFGIKVAGKSAEDVITAVAGEMALKVKNQGGQNLMPGSLSEGEGRMLRAMVPGLAQSRQGRMMLTQVLKAKVGRDFKLAELAAEWQDAHGGRLADGFEAHARRYVRENPLFPPERVKAIEELAKRLTSGKSSR